MKNEGVVISWLFSELNGESQSTFVLPNLKAERILAMMILGHQNICEPWQGVELKYLG